LEQVKKGTDEIMAKYLVFGVACATVSDEVEAHSPEEAVENADLSTGLCHQCSYEVELGDVYEISVVQDGREVWSDKQDEHTDVKTLASYLKSKKRLPAEIKTIVDRWAKKDES
jgi:hypothetical protein